MEKERLRCPSEWYDTSNLRRLLMNLSCVLADRSAVRLLSREGEQIITKLGEVRKILVEILEREDMDVNPGCCADNEDTQLRGTTTNLSPGQAREALARLAVAVSQTSQLAAEVELAAARAAIMAEEAQNGTSETTEAADSINGWPEVDEEASGKEDIAAENGTDCQPEAGHGDEGTHEQDGGENGIFSKTDIEEGDPDNTNEASDDDEEELEQNNAGSDEGLDAGGDAAEDDCEQSRSSSRVARPASGGPSKDPRPSSQASKQGPDNVNDDDDDAEDGGDGEEGGRSSNSSNTSGRPSSGRPGGKTSRPASVRAEKLSGGKTGTHSPRPPSSRSSQRSPTEKLLEWPYFVLYVSTDGGDEEIGCVIRSNDDVIEEARDLFTCRSVPHLGTTVLEESEELVSDVISIKEMTSDRDQVSSDLIDDVTDEDPEGKTGGDGTGMEAEETQSKEASDDVIDGEGADGIQDEKKEVDNIMNGIEANGMDLEEGTSHLPPKKEYLLVIGIQYSVTPRMASSREIVVKKRDTADSWSVLQSLSTESSFQEHKGPFVEVKTTGPGVFAVVARPLTDRVTITKKGGLLNSSIDSRISVTYPGDISSLMTAALRVQPAEQAVSEVRSRMRHCSDLLAASPILHLSHSTKKPFDHPVTITLSCPPNPHKASTPPTKTDEKEEKIPRATMLPQKEGAVFIRSTKSSILGGNPEEDALHLLHRSVISKSWVELDGVEIKQMRKDVVEFDIHRPYSRLLVLRMVADGRYPVSDVANIFEQALQIKYCKMILAHKSDDLESALVMCVPVRQVEGVLRKLATDGYEAPSEMSDELPLTEGMEIEVRFTGNIQMIGHTTVKFVFHSQRKNAVDMRLDYANKYGNYGSTDYRGSLECHGISKIELHDMEDPEEVLLREAEAKIEAKKRGKRKEVKEKESKEQTRNITDNKPNSLLCKLPVSLPKRASEFDITKTNLSRAEIADVPGPTSNGNLQWLASELGNEWESLVAYLGIQSNRIQSIKRNFRANQEAQIFNALVTWRSRLPKLYDKEHRLLRALTKCGRYDLAEELKYRDVDAQDETANAEEVTSAEDERTNSADE